MSRHCEARSNPELSFSNGGKLILEANFETTIEGNFEVELGSGLEINELNESQ